MMMNGEMMGNWGWWPLLPWVALCIGLLALAAVVIVWQMLGASQQGGSPPEAHEEILKRRLALGQISLEEYEVIKHQLQ